MQVSHGADEDWMHFADDLGMTGLEEADAVEERQYLLQVTVQASV